MSDVVEKILATAPPNLTKSDLMTIRFNSYVSHCYWAEWSWTGYVKKMSDGVHGRLLIGMFHRRAVVESENIRKSA